MTQRVSKRTRRDRAVQSVVRFRRMVPGLQRYARKVTGNPTLKVVPHSSSMTDGKTIFILPPIELGDDARHNGLCNDYEFDVCLCPACAADDWVMSLVKHEIGHIMYGSFDTAWDRNKVNKALNASNLDPDYEQRILKAIKSDQDSFSYYKKPKPKPQPLLYYVNKSQHHWLQFLMLVHEDLRTDYKRLENDPTERSAYDSLNMSILINGVPKPDGSVMHYLEMEKDMQACIAYLFSARGVDIDGYFDDEVVKLATTSPILQIGEDALLANDTADSFKCALQALDYWNRHQYMLPPDGSDEAEELAQALSELLKAILGHGFEVGDLAEDYSPGAGGRANKEAKPSETVGLRPEDIAKAVEALKTLESVPINCGPPIVYEPAETGPAHTSGFGLEVATKSEFVVAEKYLTPALTAARIAFGVNARVEHHRNQKAGKVSGKMLARRVPFGDERMFAKRTVPDKRSYHVVIGFDASGSSAGETIEEEKKAVLAMATVCHRLGITFEVWAHTTEYSDEASDCPALYAIKTDSERWGPNQINRLRLMKASGANLDGHTLQFYRKRVERSRSTNKIVMYYTDGAMPASNYTEELDVLKSEIAYCNKNNIALMAVGMDTDSPVEHGFDTAVVSSYGDYRKVVEHLGKKLM